MAFPSEQVVPLLVSNGGAAGPVRLPARLLPPLAAAASKPPCLCGTPCPTPPQQQVSFLGYEHNPDLMLLAARALTFLADVFPPAAAAIIRHGAVPAFCARLLTIEYIDLAEQSLQVGRSVRLLLLLAME